MNGRSTGAAADDRGRRQRVLQVIAAGARKPVPVGADTGHDLGAAERRPLEVVRYCECCQLGLVATGKVDSDER